MKRTDGLARKVYYSLPAIILGIATMLSGLVAQTANAAAVQISPRSIKLSSSAINASAQSYEVSFTQASSTVKGIVVDFCSNSPIVGDSTCTAPSGFSVTASPAITMNTGPTAGTWVAASSSPFNTLKLTNTSNSNTGITAVNFTITTVTNPSTLGTFYARIITYPNDTGANSPANYTPGSEGTIYNYGGIAMSTVNELTVTAKVQESLTFCAYVSGANCAGASGTAVPLGDANGVLANTATTYTNTANFGLGSNAQTGVTVRFKGATLTSGGNTITAHGAGSGSCTADSVTTSVEQFGLRISTAGSGVTADAGYACSSGNHSFDSANTATTYGDTLASTAGATDESQTALEFAAKSATASEAGIYTSTLTLIATGTY